jgi:hypothetical protein
MVALGLVITATTACDDDPVEVEEEEEIVEVTLTIGGVSRTSVNEQNPSSPTTIPAGTHTVTVSARGEVTQNFDLGEFELRITPSGAGVTFTRTGALTGTLAVPNAGSFTFRLELFHLEEQHVDYTVVAWPLTAT